MRSSLKKIIEKLKSSPLLIIVISISSFLFIFIITAILTKTIILKVFTNTNTIIWKEYSDERISFKYPFGANIKEAYQIREEKCSSYFPCDIGDYLQINWGNLQVTFYDLGIIDTTDPMESGYKIVAGDNFNGIGKTYTNLDKDKVRVFYFKVNEGNSMLYFLNDRFTVAFETKNDLLKYYEPIVDIIVSSSIGLSPNKDQEDSLVRITTTTCTITIFQQSTFSPCSRNNEHLYRTALNSTSKFLLIKTSIINEEAESVFEQYQEYIMVYDIEKNELIDLEKEFFPFAETDLHDTARWISEYEVASTLGYNHLIEMFDPRGEYIFNVKERTITIPESLELQEYYN